MTATFDRSGVRFQYPENWNLDETDATSGHDSITVFSPSGAFWSLCWYESSLDPHPMALEALKSLKTEYAESESEPTTEPIGEFEIPGFDVNFYYVDLSNTALIRYFRTPQASCMILCQAEDREFKQLERVFQAMTASLIRECGGVS